MSMKLIRLHGWGWSGAARHSSVGDAVGWCGCSHVIEALHDCGWSSMAQRSSVWNAVGLHGWGAMVLPCQNVSTVAQPGSVVWSGEGYGPVYLCVTRWHGMAPWVAV